MNQTATVRLKGTDEVPPPPYLGTAFGCPRDFLDNRYVYAVVSTRMGGLSLGVNMNPDKFCDFDCVYCEVNRKEPGRHTGVEVPAMEAELQRTLELVQSGGIRERPRYRSLPGELVKFGHVALSGDGEPTFCPNFGEIVEAVIHLRARGRFPFFKLILITNASGLDRPIVAEALQLFTSRDEVWAKLDVGSQEHMSQINRTGCLLEHVLTNILNLARQRPVVIQSMFPCINGMGPNPGQVEDYVQRLLELKDAGANIPLVQVYSATRPTPNAECGHLPLKTLAGIARQVREITGLRAEVF